MAWSLWFPALALPAGPINLQPADLVVLSVLPLVLAYAMQLPGALLIVMSLSLLSAFVSLLAGGQMVIFIYYLVFPTSFAAFIALVIIRPETRIIFLRHFLFAGLFSCGLFVAQIVFGVQNLDFRNNTSFSLPPHLGRGFALFPETSTFSTHLIYLLGIMLIGFRFRSLRQHLNTGGMLKWLLLAMACLAFSRSSSVILIAPLIFVFAYMKGRELSVSNLIGVTIAFAVMVLLLQLFVSNFYLERAQGSALRSIYLRGITMLTGLSVLANGEVFGVGLGNNEQVTQYAHEIARTLSFKFGLVPEGINSFVIARIFEEGWLAVITFGVAVTMLIGAVLRHQPDPTVLCFAILALASFLIGFLVTGYRGIYMNWFWLGAAPALSYLYGRSIRRHVAAGS